MQKNSDNIFDSLYYTEVLSYSLCNPQRVIIGTTIHPIHRSTDLLLVQFETNAKLYIPQNFDVSMCRGFQIWQLSVM